MKLVRLVSATSILAICACTTYTTDAALDNPACVNITPDPGQECTVYPAVCGCSDIQKNCLFLGTSPTTFQLRCETPGTVGNNGRCQSSTECVKGLQCVTNPGTNAVGVCLPYATADACTDGFLVGTPPTPTSCAIPCDPANPTSCGGGGAGCYILSATDASKHTRCAAAGLGVGANGCPKGNQSDCAPGYLCAQDSSCVRVCLVGDTRDPCPSGQVCSNANTGVSFNGMPVGACH